MNVGQGGASGVQIIHYGPLTPDLVRQRVGEIRDAVQIAARTGSIHHIDLATRLEDNLLRDVLKAIAESRCKDPTRCAAEVLKARQPDGGGGGVGWVGRHPGHISNVGHGVYR